MYVNANVNAKVERRITLPKVNIGLKSIRF